MFSRNKITFYLNLRNSHELGTLRTGIMPQDKVAHCNVCLSVHVKRLQRTVRELRGTNGLEPDRQPILPNMHECEFVR